jgi:ATP-dependent Lon protease
LQWKEEYNKRSNRRGYCKTLGVPRLERDKYENNDVAGVVTGLVLLVVIFVHRIVAISGKGTMTWNLGTNERINNNSFGIY